METRKERREREKRERKLATKARLAEPLTPPSVPVALPWRRRASGSRLVRQQRAEGAAWSLVLGGDGSSPLVLDADGFSPLVSGSAGDLAFSLAAAAAMVNGLGPVLRGRR